MNYPKPTATGPPSSAPTPSRAKGLTSWKPISPGMRGPSAPRTLPGPMPLSRRAEKRRVWHDHDVHLWRDALSTIRHRFHPGGSRSGVPELDVACHLNVVVPDTSQPGLGSALRSLRQLGYRSVVLPPLEPDTPAAPIAAAFAETGLRPITIAGLTPGADITSSDPAVRSAGLARLRSFIDFTLALGGNQMNGVPYALFGPATEPMSPTVMREAARAVGEIAEEAHDRGVVVTFEVLNRYETNAINTAEQAMQFVADSGSPHLRIHLDTFHMAR